jgi:prevent-host-death family protein
MKIYLVSNLRNKFTKIERKVKEGEQIFLTKNDKGSMVLLSIEQYTQLTENIEMKLDEADTFAESTKERLTHEDVFSDIRSLLSDRKQNIR